LTRIKKQTAYLRLIGMLNPSRIIMQARAYAVRTGIVVAA